LAPGAAPATRPAGSADALVPADAGSAGTSGSAVGVGIAEVGFDDLNKPRFYGLGALVMGRCVRRAHGAIALTRRSMRALLYPLALIKTRQQVSVDVERDNPFRVLHTIFRAEGVRGLYRGFSTIAVTMCAAAAAAAPVASALMRAACPRSCCT
jgi:hypothetical protein